MKIEKSIAGFEPQHSVDQFRYRNSVSQFAIPIYSAHFADVYKIYLNVVN